MVQNTIQAATSHNSRPRTNILYSFSDWNIPTTMFLLHVSGFLLVLEILKKSLHFFSFYVKTKIFLTSISENQVPNLFPPTYKSVLVRQTFGRLKFEKPCCSLLLSPPQPPQHKTKMSFGLLEISAPSAQN